MRFVNGNGARVDDLTDENGVCLVPRLPVGRYRVRVQTRREGPDAMLVPERVIEVVRAQEASVTMQAARPAILRGSAVLELTGLTPAQRAYAMKRRPSWGRFRGVGGSEVRSWQRFAGFRKKGATRCELQEAKVAPGTYTLRGNGWNSGGSVTWMSAPIVVPASGLAGAQIFLKPDIKEIDRGIAAEAKRAEKGARKR